MAPLSMRGHSLSVKVYHSARKYAIAYTLKRMCCYAYITFWKGGVGINIKSAVVARVSQLCEERNISYTELARLAGITPSTVYSFMQPSRGDIGITTIKKLCDGLDMSIIDFFDTEDFRNLLPEIQ